MTPVLKPSPLTACLAWAVVLFMLLPVFVTIPVSFTDQRFLAFPVDGLSLQYYENLFFTPRWRTALMQSMLVGMASALVATVLGTLCAIGCWRLANRWGNAVRLLVLAPIIVPGIVHALAFYRAWIDLGLLDTYLGLILSHTIIGLPFVVIAVSAALANFDPRIEQAARSLGAGQFETMWRILLPSIRPGILTGWLFAFIASWDEVVVVLFITSFRMQLLPKVVWDSIQEDLDPTVAAVGTIFILITMIALIVPMVIAWRRARRV